MDTDYIYRVRPINEFTLDELRNSYLWFSRPEAFKGDVEDANIAAFVENTPAIKNGFLSICHKFPFEEWYEKLGHTGICCFTQEYPTSQDISHFPKCKEGKGVCIAYNKNGVEQFLREHSIPRITRGFNKVVYDEDPTRIETCDEWSILWEKFEDFKYYRTIKEIFLSSHERDRDEFLYKLFTRINSRFSYQKEERLILGGVFIPSHDADIKGYKIPIPINLIEKILVYPKVPRKWGDELNKIGSIKNKIINYQ